MEAAMPKQVTSPRSAAVAVIAAASFSLSMLSIAQASQQGEKTRAATTAAKKHAAIHRKVSAAAADSSRCTWPYRNMFPPCMSTWPAGDPNYHGPRPGPTFDEPWEPWRK
jgi:hypothetical protein